MNDFKPRYLVERFDFNNFIKGWNLCKHSKNIVTKHWEFESILALIPMKLVLALNPIKLVLALITIKSVLALIKSGLTTLEL